VRLSKIADDLSDQNLEGVGIIVDRVIGSLTNDEYQSDTSLKKLNQTVANMRETEYTPIEIILSSIATHIWQPQRWQPHTQI